MHRTPTTALATSVVAALITATPAIAFPDRPIVLNVCQPAGGGNDRNAQTLVPFAERHLGQPLIIQYRPGAGGTLAMQEMADVEADGHTLVLCDPGGAVFGPIVQGLDFDADSVVPIARMSLIPWILTAHSSTPFETVEDLLEAASAAPGTVRGSIADVASADHYTWLLLTREAGLGPEGLRWIPYGGGAAKVRAMLAGEAEVDMLLMSLIRDPLADGTVRALAVAAEERLDEIPDVPTFRELGLEVVDGLSVGVWAPAGTPPERIETLRAGFMAIRNDPEFQAIYAQLGQDIGGFISGDDYQAVWDETWAAAGDLLRAVIQ